MEYKDLLGGKGANLAEMMSVLNLPVPHGFTISTDACRDYMHGGWPKSLTDEMTKHVAALEKKMGRKLGDSKDPPIGVGSFWCKVFNARDDGHGSESWLERQERDCPGNNYEQRAICI